MSASRRSLVSVGLLAGSLAAAVVGGYVEWSDTDGWQDREPAPWLAPVGVLLLLAGVVIACTERRARRVAGGVLAASAAGVEAIRIWVDRDLRFVWGPDDPMELFLVPAFLLGLAMLLPRVRSPRGGVTGWARAVGWLAAVVLAPVIATLAGASYYGAHDCNGSGDDCMAALGGVWWGVVALAAVVVIALVTEVVLARRRAGQRVASASAEATR